MTSCWKIYIYFLFTATIYGSSLNFDISEKERNVLELGNEKINNFRKESIQSEEFSESVNCRPRRASTSSPSSLGLVDLVRRTNTPAEQSETMNEIIRSRSSTVFVNSDNESFLLSEICARELFSSDSYSFECAWDVYEQDPDFLLKLLKSKEFDVNEAVFFTSTPLIESVRASRIELVQILIDRPETDFNNYGFFGVLPLELALNHDSIFELIMGAKTTNLNVLSENAYSENAIEVALSQEMYAKAEVMLKWAEERNLPLKTELKGKINNAMSYLSRINSEKHEIKP